VLDAWEAYHRVDSPTDYPIQHEVAAYRVAVAAPTVPALGLRTMVLSSDRPHRPGVSRRAAPDGGAGDGRAGSVAVSGKRLVSRVWDVASSGAPRGASGAGAFAAQEPNGRTFDDLVRLWSDRDEGDTYTFDPVAGDAPIPARFSPPKPVWPGPLIAVVARRFRIRDRASGVVYARLDAGSRLIRFIVEGENGASRHRLRVGFRLPRGTRPLAHVADAQYGPIVRERREWREQDYPRERPVRTAPLHRWVSVPGAFTVFARGAFEYELTDDGILAITILRSVEDLSRGDLSERPGHAGWPAATPLARDAGAFRVELALAADTATPASPAAEWAALETLAEEFHTPMAGWTLGSGIEVPEVVPGPELRGAGLVVKAVKAAEEAPGLVLRCVNVTGEPVRGAWRLPFGVREARRARLDEATQGAEAIEPTATPGTTETIVEIEVPPRGISTIVVIPVA
jgi:hypothetical protein